MPVSKQFYFRPISTKFTETQYWTEWIFYKVETTVRFFTDEAMTKFSHEKEMTFEQVPYNPTWDGTLGDVYTLIIQAM